MEEVTVYYGIDNIVKVKKIKAKKITAQLDIDGGTLNAFEGTDEIGPISWALFKDAFLIECRPIPEVDNDGKSGQI